MVTGRLRLLLVKLHLCIALGFGTLFVLLGLTGSAIVWREELDAWLNPDLLVASAPVQAPLTPEAVQALVNRLRADPGYGKPGLLMLPKDARDVFVAWYPLKEPHRLAQAAGSAFRDPYKETYKQKSQRSRQVMIDPATMAIVGERVWGEPGLSRRQWMPTLFHLHHYLLAGDAGNTLLGVTAMLMLLTVMAGVGLWWTGRRASAGSAQRGREPGVPRPMPLRVHRLAGIAVAPMLAMLAFSGWYLTLPKWVTPLVAGVLTVTPPERHASAPVPESTPPIGIGGAFAVARKAFPDATVTRIGFPRKAGDVYEVRLRQPGEVRRGSGATRMWIDAYSGQALAVRDPLKAASGDAVLNWIYPLHTGEAWGTPGRIAVSVFGLAPLLLAVTGALVWRRRRAQPHGDTRRGGPAGGRKARHARAAGGRAP